MASTEPDGRQQYPLRIPLLWILIPLVIGLTLGGWLPTKIPLLCFGLGCLALLVAAALLKKTWWERVWLPLFPSGILCFGMALGMLKSPGATPLDPPWPDRPPREAVLELRVDELYQPGGEPGSTVAGLATIADTDTHLAALRGRVVYFNLWQDSHEIVVVTSRFRVRSVIEPLSPAPTDPAFERDFEAFLRQKGVTHRLDRGRLLEQIDPGTPLRRWSGRQNRRFIEILDAPDLPLAESNETWKAMLLGQTRFLSRENRDAFRHSGTMHLFAISGLHIGIIAAIIGFSLRRCGVPLSKTPLIGLPLLFLFVQITGASPSAVRAFLMIAFFWSALLLLRRPVPFSAWTASAIAVLLLFPEQLWNPGFQLSYAVVAMILLYGLPLAASLRRHLLPYRYLPAHLFNRYQRWMVRILRVLLDSFAISLAAFLISQPISLYYFGIFSPVSLLLNVLLVLLAFPVILLGVMTLILGLVLPAFLLLPLQWLAAFVIEIMVMLIRGGLTIPGSYLEVEATPLEPVLLAVTLLLALPFLSRPLLKRADHPLALLLPPAVFCASLPFLIG